MRFLTRPHEQEAVMVNDERRPDRQGDVPSDTEHLAGETAASEPLTDRPRVQPGEAESRKASGSKDEEEREGTHHHGDGHEHGNPPHTSGKRISSPAFGSVISGGALADPGPPKN